MLKMYLSFNETLKYISWKLKLDIAYIKGKRKEMLKEVTWGFISPFSPQYKQIFFFTWKAPIRNTPATFTLPS